MKLARVLVALATVGCNNPPPNGADAPGTVVDAGPDAMALPWTTETATGLFRRVWGSGPTDVFVVGTHGETGPSHTVAIGHSTGDGTWQDQSPAVDGELWCVWGSGPNDIYAGGSLGLLLHSTGNGVWTQQTFPVTTIYNIWGSSSTDVYASDSTDHIYHSNGDGTWTPTQPAANTAYIGAIFGTSATNIYFGGGTGTNFETPLILRGPTAETIAAVAGSDLHSITKVWGSGAGDLYAVGNTDTILHSTGGGTWTLQHGPIPTVGYLDVWGSSSDDLYVTSDATSHLLHSSGNGSWNPEPIKALGVYGFAADDVYAVGPGIFHRKP